MTLAGDAIVTDSQIRAYCTYDGAFDRELYDQVVELSDKRIAREFETGALKRAARE